MNKKYLIQYIEDYLEGEHYKDEALYLNKDDYEMILEALKESIDDIQVQLRAFPTEDAEPKWIPVSERLPEVRQWVLCQCRAEIMDVLRITHDGDWEQPYPQVTYMSSFVIAWMPLPKPYEVKE